jgi:hypothetical protein
MKLTAPLIITARLMPGVRIGNAFISLDCGGGSSPRGRTIYRAFIDLADGTEHEVTDLRSGCQGGSIQDGLSALLSFLTAAAESYQYRMRTGGTEPDPDGNEGLFPPAIVEWAAENADELSMLSYLAE